MLSCLAWNYVFRPADLEFTDPHLFVYLGLQGLKVWPQCLVRFLFCIVHPEISSAFKTRKVF